MHNIESLLGTLELGPLESFQQLAFMRVYGRDLFPGKRLTLDQALESKEFSVKESGSVGHLVIQNNLAEEVFIASGMTFEGQSQNRAARYPAVIPARTTVNKFPVHCVERGQPLQGGAHYQSSTSILIPTARSEMRQERTWNSIHETMHHTQILSGTENYVAVEKKADLEEYIGFLGSSNDRQLGLIASVPLDGGVFFFLDLFGQHTTFTSLSSRLYRSIALLAKTSKGRATADENDMKGFFNTVRKTSLTRVNIDSDIRGEVYSSQDPQGTALFYLDHLAQISMKTIAVKKPQPAGVYATVP